MSWPAVMALTPIWRAGSDTASYSTATAAVVANLSSPAGNTGDAAGDTYVSIENLIGSTFADILTGDGKRNEIVGGSGTDTIKGGAGKDVLVGGAGGDKLDGGTGADRFLYHVVSDSLDGKNHDTISDFVKGDIIDLSDIDTKAADGDQGFSFIGDKAFSGKAAQLDFDVVNKAGMANDETFIFADLDGDKKADFEIQLTGLHTLTKSDFAL